MLINWIAQIKNEEKRIVFDACYPEEEARFRRSLLFTICLPLAKHLRQSQSPIVLREIHEIIERLETQIKQYYDSNPPALTEDMKLKLRKEMQQKRLSNSDIN